MVMELSLQLAILLASIGWLVLMVVIIRAMNYLHKFEEFNHRNEKELIAINNQLRKVNEHFGSVLLEIGSANRTIKGLMLEQTGKPEVEELQYADKGISRDLRNEDGLIAKAKEEVKAKAIAKVKIETKIEPKVEIEIDTDTDTKAITVTKIKAEAKTPKIPLPPHRHGPVVEIIPKIEGL